MKEIRKERNKLRQKEEKKGSLRKKKWKEEKQK